ncbi:MAG: ATP synthase F1 subunit epsilon [Bacteroidota bacterium]|nr:ATP synthase F1 subunit epsilon [Bacteroidota bacterium]
MIVEIITPEKNIFKGEASLIQLPGIDGSFEVLSNHAPMISVLKKGRIKVKIEPEQKETFFEINGGVIEVLKNKVLVLAE